MQQNLYGPYAPPAKPSQVNTQYTHEWMEKNPKKEEQNKKRSRDGFGDEDSMYNGLLGI